MIHEKQFEVIVVDDLTILKKILSNYSNEVKTIF